MRLVFMGTPALAATILSEIAERHEVVAVFTRPDAVRGRGKGLVPSDVKALALKLGIPVFTPASMRDEDVRNTLVDLAPEAICVSAYGALLPEEILAIPPAGCLNVHTSLLPRWRGAAPIERAILAGDEMTGVCIMRMEVGLDTGPYCVRRQLAVGNRSAAELTSALAEEGANALIDALELVEAGTITWTPQGSDGVTYASKIAKGELNPLPDDDARTFVAKARASSSAHPARARIAERSLAVEDAQLVNDEASAALCEDMEPGEVRFRAKRLFVRASDAPVELLRVRPDGKKSMDAKAFAGGIQGIKTANIRWGSC